LIGRVLGSRYEIIEKIGSGGMSHVYKAKCSLLNRYVAVKVLRPEYTSDDDFIKKFRRESQAAASLSHPNIVNIYDVGIDDDIHYIVMEYVEGKTLKKLIKEKEKLVPVEAAEIARQVCKALEHAHKNHIIHRDIKPHNILITREGIAKVTDFGIARAATSSTVTNSGNVIGSVHYFSPEQARGGYTSEKSDLYSLGIVMYEMVTGQIPFEGESPISIALKHLQEPLIPPGRLTENLPEGLQEIIIKATRKEMDKRYNNAGEMLKDLNQFIKNNNVVFGYGDYEEQESPTIVIPAIKSNNDDERYEKMSKQKQPVNKRKTKQKQVLTGIIVVLALVILTFGGLYLLKSYLYVKVVEVPDLIGETEEKAKEILNAKDLNMEVRKRQHNVNFPQGTIISQYPKSGTENKITNPVLVIVSMGPEKTQVPDLINRSSYEAQLKLQETGLEEGEVELQYSEEVVVGFIIEQNPRPGIKVDQGTKIDLVVSAGAEPKEINVPDVVGLDLQTAKSRIQNAGMILGDIYYQESDLVPKGYVISQSVAPGSIVEEGTSIVISVSNGTEVVDQNPSEQVERTKILKIDLPEGEKNIKVTVKKYQDGIEEVEYQRRHDGDEGPLYVDIEGKGKVRVVVLFNDIPQVDRIMDFNEEE